VLLAGVLAATGLGAVSLLTRRRGYRLGGTIAVGLLAIYTLFSPAVLLLFLPSAAVAYGGLRVLREHTLLHGRDEFVAALSIGAAPSIAVLAVDAALPALLPTPVATSFFLGSVLPGLAAYNLLRTDPRYRRRDAAWATAIYVSLVAAGVVLAAPVAALVGQAIPAVLLGGDAALAALDDEAVAAGATVAPAARETVIGVLAIAFLPSEAVRRRLGLRLGIVSLGLIAIYTLMHRWYLPLFVLETALAFAAQVPAGLDRSVRTAPEAHDLPNAKVTATRWGSDGLSYLVLGDVSAAFVAPDDHVTSAGVLDRVDARTARVRAEMLARGADEATAREHQLVHVRRTRTHCNVPGGYWVARLNPLAAEFAATGTRAPDDGPALLYTDGFDPLVTTYDEFDDPPAMAAFAAEAGVDALRDRLRDAEAADPGSVRVHGADDAAAVLVRP